MSLKYSSLIYLLVIFSAALVIEAEDRKCHFGRAYFTGCTLCACVRRELGAPATDTKIHCPDHDCPAGHVDVTPPEWFWQ